MKTNFNSIQCDGDSTVIGSETVTVLLRDSDGKVFLAVGETPPTDATAGYAKGAIFIDSNASAGAIFYINEGTNTSCDFNVTGTSGAVTLTGAQTVTGVKTLGTDTKFQIRDTGIYFYSSADGQFDVVVDTTLRITCPTSQFTGALNYSLLATADNIAYTSTYPLTALVDGAVITAKMPAANSGANCTLNVNSLGAKKLIKGSDQATQITTDVLKANGSYILVYNSSLDTGSGTWVVSGV